MVATRVSWTECLLTGLLVFGLVGTGGLLLLIMGLVYLIRPDAGTPGTFSFDPSVVAFATVAATLAGAAAWRLIVARSDCPPWRGAVAGLVVGFVAHPLCWFLMILYQTACDPSLRRASAHDVLFNLVFVTSWTSFASLGLVGWISMPLGAALGYLKKRITATAPAHP
jgi:hypothetical protein